MENNLYPMKFVPIYKSKIWGGDKFEKLLGRKDVPEKCGESWEICGMEGQESVVANGFLAGNTISELIEVYMGDLVGDSLFEKFGVEFPLLVKFIDAQDDLSVQVHPNDDVAAERHNSYGKTEMWYVVDADKGACLANGFSDNLSRQTYTDALDSDNVMSVLNNVEVSRGDMFYIPAGRVHAIGKGVLVAEIQEPSDITYRIYDYNRRDDQGNLRELHTAQALDVLDFGKVDNCKADYKPVPNKSVNGIKCGYFTANVLDLAMPVEKDFPEIDSFIIYMCMDGACRIEYDDDHSYVEMAMGDTVLVPAVIKNLCFFPNGNARLLEVYVEA